jgi:hypothetical protein
MVLTGEVTQYRMYWLLHASQMLYRALDTIAFGIVIRHADVLVFCGLEIIRAQYCIEQMGRQHSPVENAEVSRGDLAANGSASYRLRDIALSRLTSFMLSFNVINRRLCSELPIVRMRSCVATLETVSLRLSLWSRLNDMISSFRVRSQTW